MRAIVTTYAGEKIVLKGLSKAEIMSLLGQRVITKGRIVNSPIYMIQIGPK